MNKQKKMKKSSFLIRAYLVLLVTIISFFTLYAYRNVALDYLIEENHIKVDLNEKELKELQNTLKQYEPTMNNKEKIKHEIEKQIGDHYAFICLVESPVEPIEYAKETPIFINTSTSRPIPDELWKYSFSYPFFFSNNIPSTIFFYPLFNDYYAFIRIVCLTLSILIGTLFAFLLKTAYHHNWGKRLSSYFKNFSILKWTQHLSVKLMAIHFISLLIALMLFLFLYENRYSFFEFMNEIHYQSLDADSIAKEIQTMVSENEFTFDVTNGDTSLSKKEKTTLKEKYTKKVSRELDKIAPDTMDIYIYDENAIYFAGTANSSVTSKFIIDNVYDVSIVINPYLYTYPIMFKDGIGELWIFSYPLVELMIPYIVIISMIAISIYLLISLSFIQKKVKHIKYIYDDIGILSNGDWNHSVWQNDSDEIGQLGEHLNHMRVSFMENMENEIEARKANKNLISAISHDIRTPLTTLQGYLEIIQMNKVDEKKKEEYIGRCLNKVEELHELSNKMFEYALVFSTEDSTELSTIPIQDIKNLIEDHIQFLKLNEFEVDAKLIDSIYSIQGNIPLLKRIFNNIFSNIQKYGDSQSTCTILMNIEKHTLKLSFMNTKKQDLENIESNGIGLKSVNKMMHIHHGECYIKNTNTSFLIVLEFPLFEKIA